MARSFFGCISIAIPRLFPGLRLCRDGGVRTDLAVTQRRSRGEFERVPRPGLGPMDRARGKLEHGVCGETR